MLHSGSQLVGRSVLLRGVRLGAVEDVLLDAHARRVLGFVVHCGDGERRMLPLSAAESEDRQVAVSSALVLMEGAFYRTRCLLLTTALGASVLRHGRPEGSLADVLFGDEGSVESFVLDGDAELALADGVTLDPVVRAKAV